MSVQTSREPPPDTVGNLPEVDSVGPPDALVESARYGSTQSTCCEPPGARSR